MSRKEKPLPFFAIGNDELAEKRPLIGDVAKCPRCKKEHKVQYGTDTKTGKISKMLGFVTCKNNRSYLVAINNLVL